MSSRPGSYLAEDRLDSWKEIAAYLGREVRTVQGWEKTEALPIHRHQHARQGSVYAFKPELDAWREARRESPEATARPLPVETSPINTSPADPSTAIPEPAPPRIPRRPLIAGALLLAACLVGLALWKYRAARSNAEIPSSVAVLPFVDFSPQKDQEYFSDGLTEEIIDALSRVPDLRVVARTSAFAFKGKAADIRQIGRQLNVSAVLEGSVRKANDQLRITAQLNRTSDGYHLWSRTYDRQLRDIFTVQRDISQAIADQLRAGPVPPRSTTGDVEAYRLYQKGRYFFNQFDISGSHQKAIECYRQAIQRDPNFAEAYAGMADAYAYLAEEFQVAPREVMPKAKEAAEKAVGLDGNSAAAHTSLGIVKLDYERDIEGGQREFLKAMALNPGSGYSHHWYAHSLEAQGRLNEAMHEMRAALDLDPLAVPINWDVGTELIAAGRYNDARSVLNKALELFPNNPLIDFLSIQLYLDQGNVAEARRLLDRANIQTPGLLEEPLFMSVAASCAAREGRKHQARETLDRIEGMRKTRYVEPFAAVSLCSELHDRECVTRWLKRADEERSTLFVYLPLLKSV